MEQQKYMLQRDHDSQTLKWADIDLQCGMKECMFWLPQSMHGIIKVSKVNRFISRV